MAKRFNIFPDKSYAQALRKSKAFKWKDGTTEYSLATPIIFNNLETKAILPIQIKYETGVGKNGKMKYGTKFEIRGIQFDNEDDMIEYKSTLANYARNQIVTEGNSGAEARDEMEIPDLLKNKGGRLWFNTTPKKELKSRIFIDLMKRKKQSIGQATQNVSKEYDLSAGLLLENIGNDFSLHTGRIEGPSKAPPFEIFGAEFEGDSRKEAWNEILGDDYARMSNALKENRLDGYFTIRENRNDFKTSIDDQWLNDETLRKLEGDFDEAEVAITNINIKPNSYVVPKDPLAKKYADELERAGIHLIENPKISNKNINWKYILGEYKSEYLKMLSNDVLGDAYEIRPEDVDAFDFSNQIEKMLAGEKFNGNIDISETASYSATPYYFELQGDGIIPIDLTQHMEFNRSDDLDGYASKIKIPITSSDDKERILAKMKENSNYLFDSGFHYSSDNNDDEKWALIIGKPNRSNQGLFWRVFNYDDAITKGKDPLLEFEDILNEVHDVANRTENRYHIPEARIFKLYGEDGLDMFYESASEGEVDIAKLFKDGEFEIGSYDSKGAEMMSSVISMKEAEGAGWSLDGEVQKRPEMKLDEPILVYDRKDDSDGNVLDEEDSQIPSSYQQSIDGGLAINKKEYLDKLTGKEQAEWEEWLDKQVPNASGAERKRVIEDLKDFPGNQGIRFDVAFEGDMPTFEYTFIRGSGDRVPLNKKIIPRRSLNRKEKLTVGERFRDSEGETRFAADLRFKRTIKDKFGRKRVYRSNPAGKGLIIWKNQEAAKAIAQIGRRNGWLVRTIPTKKGYVNIATKRKVGEEVAVSKTKVQKAREEPGGKRLQQKRKDVWTVLSTSCKAEA